MMSPRLTQTFWTSQGNKVSGLFSDPVDRMEADRGRARKIFRCGRTPLVSTGTVIRRGAVRYLLIHHSNETEDVRFLAYEITHTLAHTRMTKGIDPVTRMEGDTILKTIDTALPVVVEPAGILEEQGLERTKYLIRAPGEILPGDKIGPYTVHTVQVVPGVSIIGAY